MRVLHTTNYLPHSHDHWGGAEVACENIIELLQLKGVACAVAANPPQRALKGNFRFYGLRSMLHTDHSTYLFFLRHYWLQKDDLVYASMQDTLEDFKPDVVHFHNFSSLTFSALKAVKDAAIPAIYSVYDYWFFCPTNMLVDFDTKLCLKSHGFSCLFKCLGDQITRKSQYLLNLPIITRRLNFAKNLSMFDKIITLSENSRDVMRRFGSSGLEVDVVRLPVKLSNKDIGNERYEHPTVMYAGWVQARKGPDILVKSMPMLLKAFPDARLMIVGALAEPEFEKYIKSLAESLNVTDNVVFCGKLSQNEFDEVFAKSHIVAVAEQWENMSPMFMLEAMNAKKAIVCGAIGGIPEFIRHRQEGLLAEYDNPESYATQIIRILKNPQEANMYGVNARNRVRVLCDRDNIANNLLALYQGVIG